MEPLSLARFLIQSVISGVANPDLSRYSDEPQDDFAKIWWIHPRVVEITIAW
jgi:hypothetical protein